MFAKIGFRHFFISTISALAVASGALASQPADGKRCVALKTDAVRLACYDTVFGRLATPENPETPPAAADNIASEKTTAPDRGKWLVSIDKSALTDDRNVYLNLYSKNEIAGRFGDAGRGYLSLRCKENTTAVIFTFNDQFMASIQGYGKIEYRLDDAKMRQIHTQESTNNMALGLWSGRKAIPFIKGLLGHERLIVRATPYNESTYTLTYDISGLENVIGELRKTCHW